MNRQRDLICVVLIQVIDVCHGPKKINWPMPSIAIDFVGYLVIKESY